MMHVQPQKEHQWLQKMVGEWSYRTQACGAPEQLRDDCGRLADDPCDRRHLGAGRGTRRDAGRGAAQP